MSAMDRCTLGLILWLGLTAQTQAQLASPEADRLYRQSLPATDDPRWEKIFRDPATLFYTDAEMPPAYQKWDGDLRGVHSPAYNISADANEQAKGPGRGGNGNIEFPWRAPGGTDAARNVATVRFMRLPDREAGGVWPVVWWRERMRGANIGEEPVYRWLFPRGTVFGEVLTLADSSGVQHTFEVRLRVREADYWDVQILRPFPTRASLAARLRELQVENHEAWIASLERQPVARQTLRDRLHPMSAFAERAGSQALPPMSERLAAELLDSTPFVSSVGAEWGEPDQDVFAPTTDQTFHLVPHGYQATFLGTDTESCQECHKHTLRHVDTFDGRRDWYGRVRGSDGIFTFHPFARESISRNGSPLTVRMNARLEAAGIIERFAAARHPADVYRRRIVPQ